MPLFFSPNVQATAPDLPANFRAELKEWDRDRLVDAVVPLAGLIFGRRDALADLARLTLPALLVIYRGTGYSPSRCGGPPDGNRHGLPLHRIARGRPYLLPRDAGRRHRSSARLPR